MDDPSAVHDLIETRVRVASWNLWWRFGPWEARLPLIVDELRRVDADVVALQEVWITDEGSSSRHIASELGYGHVEAALAEMSPGVLFGNAVLSRWPITENEWRQAANHRDRYWLYVVYHCETQTPTLHRVATKASRSTRTARRRERPHVPGAGGNAGPFLFPRSVTK